jgi:hypothetical protein
VEPFDAVKAGTAHVPPPPIVIADTCSVKVKKSTAPVAASGPAADPAAAAYVKSVVGKGFKAILDAVGSQVVPAVSSALPPKAVVSMDCWHQVVHWFPCIFPSRLRCGCDQALGKTVVEVGGALVTITVARPAVRFAPDDVLAAVVRGMFDAAVVCAVFRTVF